MAAVLGSTYPALYSAVGIHSGLPYKSAHDVNSALALFDANGSASDRSGHNYAGQAGLTEFLLNSGFGSLTSSSPIIPCTTSRTRSKSREVSTRLL